MCSYLLIYLSLPHKERKNREEYKSFGQFVSTIHFSYRRLFSIFLYGDCGILYCDISVIGADWPFVFYKYLDSITDSKILHSNKNNVSTK